MNINDYVVAQQKGGKPFIMQLKTLDSKAEVSGVLENKRREEIKVIEIKTKDILVNLGPTPHPGKVYNLDVSNLYRKAIEHDFWGTLYFYVKLDKATLKMLQNSLDRTAKWVDKAGLEAYVGQSDIEIRAKHGKWAGMYRHNPKGRNVTWYAPDWAQGSSEAMDQVVIHELGHCIRYNGLDDALKLRQRWLKLYQQVVSPVVIPQKATSSIWNKLKDARDADEEITWTEALKDVSAIDEKYERANKIILKWLKQVQRIGGKELTLAWKAGDLEFIEGVWPKSALDSSTLSPVISEYSTVNVEELFAETFTFHMTKKKLPAEYSELMEKSLLWAKKRNFD